MTDTPHEAMIPRGALIAVGALLAISLAGTAATRLARLSTPAGAPVAAPAPAASVDLRFIDMADGSVVVRHADTGAVAATVAPGVGGFVRGVMRGLARDRISRGIGESPPFRLSEARDGRLTLQDTATGRQIDLEAFGVGNRASFLVMLHPAAGAGA